MARRWLTAIDLSKNELQNARIQNLSTAPSSPVAGQLYYDTDDNQILYYNGTAWIDADGQDASAALAAHAAAGNPHTVYMLTSAHNDVAHNTVEINDLAAPDADVSWGGFKITNVADPASAQDAATKAYVDGVASGLDVKSSVRAATTAAGTLASSFENGDAIDGVTLATGDRILIKNQAAGAENGIYTVNASGAPTRATDANVSAEVTAGMFVFVEAGTVNADTGWVLSTDGAITLGSTALTFTQFSSAAAFTAGNGLVLTGTVLDVVAGTGIVANANDLAVNRTGTNGSHVPLLYAADVGDGSSTSITVTHNLGTKDVLVQVWDKSTPYAQVECDVEHATTNTVTLKFATAPTSAQYRATVLG